LLVPVCAALRKSKQARASCAGFLAVLVTLECRFRYAR
jgi:hypothetical protein